MEVKTRGLLQWIVAGSRVEDVGGGWWSYVW
jgi:hypothetical protein